MSLLDPFAIFDQVLQSAILQDVYVAIRTDNPGNTLPIGSGTLTDPFGGPADSGTWFDYVMANNLGTGPVTVRLGPGTFRTAGADGAGNVSGGGWTARSGLRILGAGIAQTTLKLAFSGSSQTRWAVGMPAGLSTGSSPLNGFEASDFQIDCGFASGTNGFGAVCVYGTHIYLRRIKAKNFGINDASGYLTVFLFASWNSEDCVVSECIADTVASSNSGNVILFGAYNGTTPPHRFCVVRNCWAQGVATASPLPAVSDNVKGISPGVGLGTIIEGNVIANVGPAVAGINSAIQDLIVRDNYFRNVHYGISWDQQGGSAVGRIVAVSNVVDLSKSLSQPVGFSFLGNAGATRYSSLIIRKNVIRQTDDSVTPRTDATGIFFTETNTAIVEDNIINDVQYASTGYSAVVFNDVVSPKCFNNQDSSGKLLQGWDNAKYTLLSELGTQVKNVPLAVSHR